MSPRRKAENTPKLTDGDKEQPKKKKNSKTKSDTKDNETTDLALNKEENKIENQNSITSNQPQEKKNTAYYLPAHEDTFIKEGNDIQIKKPEIQLDVRPELGTERI